MQLIFCHLFVVLLLALSHLTESARSSAQRAGGGKRRKNKAGGGVDDSTEERRTGGKKRRRKENSDIDGGSLFDFSLNANGESDSATEYSPMEISDMGYDFLTKGDIKSAIEKFTQSADHYGLSLCYTSGPERDLRLALAHASDALKENPSVPPIYFQRSRLAGFLGLYDTMEADIHALIGLGADISVLESHAESFRMAQYCTASVKMHQILKDMTSDPVRHAKYNVNIGLCQEELGDIQGAYDYISKALELDGNGVDALHSSKLARYLLDLGRVEEAVELSVRTIRRLEEDLEALDRMHSSQHTEALEYAISKHLRVAVVLFQELGMPHKSVEYAKRIQFGGGVDFVSAVVAIDSYQALADFPSALDLADAMVSRSSQADLRGLFRYRREIACINYCVLDLPFSGYSIDTVVDTRIKYARTKVFGIEDEFVAMDTYTDLWEKCARRRAAHESLYGKPLSSYESPEFHERVSSLNQVTSKVRNTLQLNAAGFYKHNRKDRAFGFAAVDMNQMLRRRMHCIVDGYDDLYVSNFGASKSDMISPDDLANIFAPALAYPSFCGRRSDDRAIIEDSFHPFEWRDLFDVGVRWRQLAEPTDPVWWMDRFDEFKGKGKEDTVSTPMIAAQKKVPRYYPYVNETLALFKKTMRHCYSTENITCIKLSEDQKRDLDRVSTVEELYGLHSGIGEEVFIVANCTSAVHMDRAMPCTKLVLTPSRAKGEGWEYRISASYSTEVYPSYFADLDILFQRYNNKLVEIHSTTSPDTRGKLTERIVDDVLDIVYTWVHCSPLSRGSASLAYTSAVSMLLAADVCVQGEFPAGKQLDWEALLSTTPRDFKAKVRPWFDDIKKYPISSFCPELAGPWLEGAGEHSLSSHMFISSRAVLSALSMDVK